MSLPITIARLAVCHVPGWNLKESRRGRRKGESKESEIKRKEGCQEIRKR
jgi:hypothetical protein